MNNHLPPAPAEERETPVVSELRERAARYFRNWGGGTEEAVDVDELIRDLVVALPAEDRAVTAPNCVISETVPNWCLEHHCYATTCARAVTAPQEPEPPPSLSPRQRAQLVLNGLRLSDDIEGKLAQAFAECEDDTIALEQAESEAKLAALTHAIEALRGELETLKATKKES